MSKENINLPKTAFSMKANLPLKEPGLIEYWDKINLYEELRKSNKGTYIRGTSIPLFTRNKKTGKKNRGLKKNGPRSLPKN